MMTLSQRMAESAHNRPDARVVREWVGILERLGACDAAWLWCEESGLTYEEAWEACRRGDWLVWLLCKARVVSHESYGLYGSCQACDLAHATAREIRERFTRPTLLEVMRGGGQP